MATISVRSISLSVVLSLTLVASVAANTITIQPSSQDAFITQDSPNRVAGANPTNTRIRVKGSASSTIRRGLVQFSLVGIPFHSTVNSAIAELWAANAGGNPTHGLHDVTAPWSQSTVTWNNAPSFAVSPTATAVISGTGFWSFDVTPDVDADVNLFCGGYGWLIKDEVETASIPFANYVSLEDDTTLQLAKRPRLTVDYTPPPCTTNADCADQNVCTTNEQCVAGFCQVTAVNCDDGNPCTHDTCDCNSGCVNSNICDDGFSCTTDVCNPSTLACTYTPNNAACSNDCGTRTCSGDPDSITIDPTTGCDFTTTQLDGTPCSSGDICSINETCEAGVCQGGASSCGDGTVQPSCGEECDVPGGGPNCTTACRFVCGPTPQVGCRIPAEAQKASIGLKNKSPDSKDDFNWKYVKGTATTPADLGDPLTTTDYTLCVYDQSAAPQPIMFMRAPAGGTCDTKPCWTLIRGGFKYKDKLFTPEGLQQLLLKSGPEAKSKIQVKGKGDLLPMPTLPLTLPLTVQLKSETGVCWEARYSTAKTNTSESFKAKAD